MSTNPQVMTLRIPTDLSEEFAFAARVLGVSISDLMRTALRAEIDRLRTDEAFQQRLRERIAAYQALLASLSEGPST